MTKMLQKGNGSKCGCCKRKKQKAVHLHKGGKRQHLKKAMGGGCNIMLEMKDLVKKQ